MRAGSEQVTAGDAVWEFASTECFPFAGCVLRSGWERVTVWSVSRPGKCRVEHDLPGELGCSGGAVRVAAPCMAMGCTVAG